MLYSQPTRIKRLFVTAVAGLTLLIACGKTAKKSTTQTAIDPEQIKSGATVLPKATISTKDISTDEQTALASNDCGGNYSAPIQIDAPPLQAVDGKRPIISGNKGICDVLTKAVGLVQIVKADCQDCGDAMEKASKLIKASKYADKIQHIIIGSPEAGKEDISTVEQAAEQAQTGVTVYKDAGAWDIFAKDKANHNYSVFFVMARSGQGAVYANAANADTAAVEAATTMAGAVQAAADNDQAGEIQEYKLTVEWDGTTNYGNADYDFILAR